MGGRGWGGRSLVGSVEECKDYALSKMLCFLFFAKVVTMEYVVVAVLCVGRTLGTLGGYPFFPIF